MRPDNFPSSANMESASGNQSHWLIVAKRRMCPPKRAGDPVGFSCFEFQTKMTLDFVASETKSAGLVLRKHDNDNNGIILGHCQEEFHGYDDGLQQQK